MTAATEVPADTLDELREQLVVRHQELVRYGLVVWTAGNVSARVPGTELFLIKASGVSYDGLRPDQMVLCYLDGTLAEETDLKPSSDTAAHAYVYRHMPEVGGQVHTHSPYACAFAAVGQPVPCVLTGIADEFGGEIPIGPQARVGDDSIGRSVVNTLRGQPSRAVLVARHGPFTIGPDAKAAVKAAVLCEDSARSAHLALALGDPAPLNDDEISALHDRYRNVYGQRT
jgi:L-ribulose-5-phosphate 4-epimerase